MPTKLLSLRSMQSVLDVAVHQRSGEHVERNTLLFGGMGACLGSHLVSVFVGASSYVKRDWGQRPGVMLSCSHMVVGMKGCHFLAQDKAWALKKSFRGNETAIGNQCRDCYELWQVAFSNTPWAELSALLLKGKDPVVQAWEAARKVKAGLAEKTYVAASVKDEKTYSMEIFRTFLIISEKELRKCAKVSKLTKEQVKGLVEMTIPCEENADKMEKVFIFKDPSAPHRKLKLSMHTGQTLEREHMKPNDHLWAQQGENTLLHVKKIHDSKFNLPNLLQKDNLLDWDSYRKKRLAPEEEDIGSDFANKNASWHGGAFGSAEGQWQEDQLASITVKKEQEENDDDDEMEDLGDLSTLVGPASQNMTSNGMEVGKDLEAGMFPKEGLERKRSQSSIATPPSKRKCTSASGLESLSGKALTVASSARDGSSVPEGDGPMMELGRMTGQTPHTLCVKGHPLVGKLSKGCCSCDYSKAFHLWLRGLCLCMA